MLHFANGDNQLGPRVQAGCRASASPRQVRDLGTGTCLEWQCLLLQDAAAQESVLAKAVIPSSLASGHTDLTAFAGSASQTLVLPFPKKPLSLLG